MFYTDLKKESLVMNSKELREKAIKRYENGESPKEIYQSLGKGKSWFFKWLKRYKLDGKDWAIKTILLDPIKALKGSIKLWNR